MRTRFPSVVATIVAGVTLACNDAAVEQITAPPLAATPAQPVSNMYPGTWEYTAAGIPAAIGMRITTTPKWENDYQIFTVVASVKFEWANYVTAGLNTSLVDKAGRNVNSGSAGVTYSRFLLPVASGDTTFVVSISTHGQKCGLMGKHTYSGSAQQQAINVSFVQVTVYRHDVLLTSGPDILQPACPPPPPPPDECDEPASRLIGGIGGPVASTGEDCDAPAPPNGGSTESIEVCYTIWREYWYYDYVTRRSYLIARYPIGTMCYMT
jgi:hypothetical protein